MNREIKESEQQPIKGIATNQLQLEGKSEGIEFEPEAIEKVISTTRSSSVCYMFFGLVDFGVVLGALIALPSECDVTNLKDYFIIALSLTILKLFYLGFQIQIFSKELQNIKTAGKNHTLTHDPKSFAKSETYIASTKKNNTCFGLISYLYIAFEVGYFIYANIVLYSDMSSVCQIGEPQYDYTWGIALYFLIERYIGLGLPILLFFCSLCCLPCLAMFGLAAMDMQTQQKQQQEQQQPKQQQTEDSHKQENQLEIQIQDYEIVKERVTDENICSICTQEFKIGQAIQRLKCDKNHVFHKECLSGWIKAQSECPICKNPINKDYNEKLLNKI